MFILCVLDNMRKKFFSLFFFLNSSNSTRKNTMLEISDKINFITQSTTSNTPLAIFY